MKIKKWRFEAMKVNESKWKKNRYFAWVKLFVLPKHNSLRTSLHAENSLRCSIHTIKACIQCITVTILGFCTRAPRFDCCVMFSTYSLLLVYIFINLEHFFTCWMALLLQTYKQMHLLHFLPVMRLLAFYTVKPINKQSNFVQLDHQSAALIKCEKVCTGTHPYDVAILT